MQQVARVSNYTGFVYPGKLIECGKTGQIFEPPKEVLTGNYIKGRFGEENTWQKNSIQDLKLL